MAAEASNVTFSHDSFQRQNTGVYLSQVCLFIRVQNLSQKPARHTDHHYLRKRPKPNQDSSSKKIGELPIDGYLRKQQCLSHLLTKKPFSVRRSTDKNYI